MNGDDELDARFLLSARTSIDVLSHQTPSPVAQRDVAGSALAPLGADPLDAPPPLSGIGGFLPPSP
jgi:hypothetical protein